MGLILSDLYSGCVLRAFAIQIVVLHFAMCGMPQDVFIRSAAISSAGFWVGVLVVVIRRPTSPEIYASFETGLPTSQSSG